MKTLTFKIILLFLFIPFGFAQTNSHSKYSIWFDKPTDLSGQSVWIKDRGLGMNPDSIWEQYSLPIGNGSFGANIMGSVSVDRVTLNEKTLWRGGPNTANGASYYWNVNKLSARYLPIIRQAFMDKDLDKVRTLTENNFNGLAAYEETDESPFRFGSFTTLGELYLETGLEEKEISDYKRALSLDSAVVNVSFKEKNTMYSRSYFASYPDSVIVIRYTSDQKAKQNIKLFYAPNPESRGVCIKKGSDRILFKRELLNNNQQFALEIKCIPIGGYYENIENGISICDADEVVFVLSAATDYQMNFNPDFSDPKTYVGLPPEIKTSQRLLRLNGQDYNQMLNEHLQDYQSLFNRVHIDLNSIHSFSSLPTDLRLAQYKEGKLDKAFEELYYQYGRYLLIASSRIGSMPANLQGLWHNNIDGQWRVDYHNNINIQMNYWPASTANLSECIPPLIDFIKTLVKPGKVTAQSYYNARGWTASISSNIFGFTAPLSSKDMSWNFNPMAGPWLATHVWDYFDYTQDLDFLKETGYELIKESANFAVDYLWKMPNGVYSAAPSTSPEHGPIDQGATFVHAVIRQVLSNAIEASKLLREDDDNRQEWIAVLNNLAPYQVGRYGQLMEWSEDIDDPNDNHRHVNHLFGLHPGNSISPITTPQLADAAKVVLEHRGDFATGWSMGWKLNQWARLLDGNHAYKLFQNLLQCGTLPNLWDTHPPFQIDGNFGGIAGVMEMLLQSHMGFIHLLPALPDAWDTGSISGLVARGNFEVSMVWKKCELIEAQIFSRKGGDCSVLYKNSQLKFSSIEGETYTIIYSGSKLQLKSE